MNPSEREAEEILLQKGFAEPEDLEPEMVELLRQAVMEGKRACQEKDLPAVVWRGRVTFTLRGRWRKLKV